MSWNGVKKQASIDIESIETWCEEMGIEDYTVSSKGEIDVDGSVDLRDKNFKELPYKFGRVNGYFEISSNKNLISLKNCPDYIKYSFDCNLCKKLDSLEGCPSIVDGNFFCRNCKREFTEKEVKSLCKVKEYIVRK